MEEHIRKTMFKLLDSLHVIINLNYKGDIRPTKSELLGENIVAMTAKVNIKLPYTHASN